MSKKPRQAQARKIPNNASTQPRRPNQPRPAAPALPPKSTANPKSKSSEKVSVPPKTLSVPWIIVVAAAIATSSIFLPDNWAFSWTKDPSPGWAQPAVLLVGLIAMIPFLHALAATQGLATTKSSTIEDRKLWRAVCEKALLYVAAGIFSGTLYALFTFDGAPSSVKITSVIADLATIGGILGLAACIPYNIKMTATALRKLRIVKKKSWQLTTQAVAIMDLLISYKLLFLLPFILHGFA